MRRLAVLVLALSVVAAACGGDKEDASDSSASSDETTTTTLTTESSVSGTEAPTGPNATGSGKGATAPAAPSGSGSGGGATTTTAGSSSSGSSSSSSGVAAAGNYTYNRIGKMTSNAFPERSLDGTVSLKIDPANGNEQHSTQTSSEASSEQVLRFLSEGAYFTYLKRSESGLSKEFVPNPPVLAVPANPTVGRTWSWTVTSKDGATTLNADFRVDRTETVAIGGERVQTIVLVTVLKTSGDVQLTTNLTSWVSVAKGLVVKSNEVSDGAAGSITFHKESSMTMASTKPS